MRATPLLCLALIACGGDTSIAKIPNNPPEVSISSPPDGSSFDEGDLITFTAAVSDDTDPSPSLFLVWQSDLDGVLEEGTQADGEGWVSWVTANLTPGNHAISLTAVDSDAAQGSDVLELTIHDVPDAPEIAILHPVPGESGEEGVSYTFAAVVSDLQDLDPQDLVVTVSSDIQPRGEDFCTATPNEAGLASCDFALDPGGHTLTFEVTDTDLLTGTATVYFEVLAASAVDDDGDGWTEDQGDCDDTDPSVHPTAEEYYNGIDDDCDGLIDEGTVGYDDDGDSWSELDGDCDNADARTYPDATEACDGVDNDCDGIIDEDTVCYDDDGDCWCEGGTCEGSIYASCHSLGTGDCDDDDPAAYPHAPETADGVDNDCDGTIDEGTEAFDDDGDCACEIGPCQGSVDATCTVLIDGDCDDTDDTIGPAALEYCNGVDDDCDGATDEGSAVDAAAWYRDWDGDGYGDPAISAAACTQPSGYVGNASDCDDSDAALNPLTFWYLDADSDGYGRATYYVQQCTQPPGYVSNNSDCDDTRSASRPGATEYCNGYDDDCDGVTDESTAADASTWYLDSDGDGYGSTTSTRACYAPTGYVSNRSDCYDSNSAANPGATSTYYRVNRGDGSYDYNCDGSESRLYTSTYSCSVDWDGFSCSSYTNGWASSIPACGASGSWRSGCSASFWSCSYGSSSTAYQYCI